MEHLPESTILLYSQLLSQCLHAAVPSGRGLSFVKKNIKNSTQWYLQLTVGEKKTQHYLGPDSKELKELIKNEKALWKNAEPDRQLREQLVTMLIGGGALTVSTAEARLFEVIERTGVFLVGGVIVGSHAFSIYGNMLGVLWPTKLTQTHDVDIARDNHITLGIQKDPVDLKQALLDAEMGFVETPAFNRKSPSTSFKIRRQQLSVDVLTPMIGKPNSEPLFIQVLNTYAEPVRFLDYLLEDIQPAAIIAKAGILVNVPSPARYAIHKLVTSVHRPAAMQGKSIKDIEQAKMLLSVLIEDRPGDIYQAINAAQQMPEKFFEQMKNGVMKLPKELISSLNDFL